MNRTEADSGKGRLLTVLLSLAVVIVAIDQVSKFYAVERLTPGVIVPIIGDYLGWQLIYNPGAAFSMATGMTWVLTIVAVVVVVVVLRVARKLRSRVWAVALGLLLGGAIGNLVDRLVRDPGFAQGHVVDFINYNGWFVGNVADIAIVLAAVLIAVLALVGLEVDGQRPGRDAEETPVPDGEADGLDREESLLSEEPVVDDDEFSPLVPEPADGEVDLASWVTGTVDGDEPAAERGGKGRAAKGSAARAEADERAEAVAAEPAVTAPAERAVIDEPAEVSDDSDPAATTEAAGTPESAGTPEPAATDAAAPGTPAGTAGATTPAEPAAPATPPRRYRSRREMRAATETTTSDDG